MKVINVSTNDWAVLLNGSNATVRAGQEIEVGLLPVTIGGQTVQENLSTNYVCFLGDAAWQAVPVRSDHENFTAGMIWALPFMAILGTFWAVRRALTMDGVS